MSEIFFLEPYYARLYHSDQPFDPSKLRYGTLTKQPESDGDGFGCIAMILVPCLCLLIALLVPYIGDQIHDRTLKSEGLQVEITVTDCAMVWVDRYEQDPKITYDYRVDGTDYTQQQILNTSARCDQFRPGTMLSGLYLQTTPDEITILLDDYSKDDTPLNVFVALVSVCILMTLLIVDASIPSITNHRYRALTSRGVLLDGQLIEAVGHLDEKSKNYTVTATYSFMTPKKRELVRKQSFMRNDFKVKKLPRKGTPVKVLYASDDACVML